MIALCPYCNLKIETNSREELAEKLAEHVVVKHEGVGAEN